MVGPPLPLIPLVYAPDDDDDDGIPVNCCTIARKLLVSVLSSVTGARLEALDLRLGDFPIRPGGLPLPEVAVKSGMDMDVMDEILIPPAAAEAEAEAWLWP